MPFELPVDTGTSIQPVIPVPARPSAKLQLEIVKKSALPLNTMPLARFEKLQSYTPQYGLVLEAMVVMAVAPEPRNSQPVKLTNSAFFSETALAPVALGLKISPWKWMRVIELIEFWTTNMVMTDVVVTTAPQPTRTSCGVLVAPPPSIVMLELMTYWPGGK